MYELTVEVTAQEFKPQSGLVDVSGWMDANVATDDWRREDVLIYLGAVQVSTKFLCLKKEIIYISCTPFQILSLV